MVDQWLTLQYDCGAAASIDGFFIRAYEGGARTDYDFRLRDRQIYATGTNASMHEPRPISLIGA
jgi:hypothetical protein